MLPMGRALRAIMLYALAGAAVGSGYVIVTAGFDSRAVIRGAAIGLTIAGVIGAFEVTVVKAAARRFFLRLPFLLNVALRTAVYAPVILGSLTFWTLAVPLPEEVDAAYPSLGMMGVDAGFSLLIIALFNAFHAIQELLGPRELVNFLSGRYHTPREERRILLFLDMVNSTALAERLGDRRFHALLNDFCADLTGPIADHGGEIHSYVGDEIVASWRETRGLRHGACLRAVFEGRRALSAQAERYRRKHGVAPEFRAGLHAGDVVAGEMGSLKKEIVLVGDAVNTTARIEQACREFERRTMVSGPLLEQLTLPEDLHAEYLGDVVLRGRQAPLSLYAVKGSCAAPVAADPPAQSRCFPSDAGPVHDGSPTGTAER